MSKVKVSISTIAMLLLLSTFSMVAFASGSLAHKVSGLSGLYNSTTQKVTIAWEKLDSATEYTVVWDTGDGGTATTQTIAQPATGDTVKAEITGIAVDNKTYTYYVVPVGTDAATTAKNYGTVTAKETKQILSGSRNNAGEVEGHKTHGDFQNNTNACATCHSAHTAGNTKLLKYTGTSDYQTCTACHDGTMGFYNVNASGHDAGAAGTFGNFTEATNTNDASDNDASMHSVTGVANVNSAPHQGKTANASSTFGCSSCHSPHGGTTNERLISDTVAGKAWASRDDRLANSSYKTYIEGVEAGTKTPVAKNFDLELEVLPISETLGFDITVSHGPAGDGETDIVAGMFFNKFCFGCHEGLDRSKTVKGDETNVATEDIGTHTHNTQSGKYGRNCWSCHYSHGTDETVLMDTAGRMLEDLMKPTTELIDRSTVHGSTTEAVLNTKGFSYTQSVYGLGLDKTAAKEYMKDLTVGGSKLKKYTNSASCWSCHYTSSAIKSTIAPTDYNFSGKPLK